ncbi:arabinogalactan endo-1,4-beta-galactosidase [Kribbella sp. NBC_00482]|uniref:glycoside hydrolase family 53 protein n=1 Tax=Kribbella sp. NBC_00482 TaxID=2975968 RepID=UPI002E18D8EB
MREITRRTALGGAAVVALGGAGALPARAATVRQTVVLPGRGWWTVSVWAKSGGALNAGTLSVRGVSTVVAQTLQDDKWVRSAVSVYADRRQQCTVDLITAEGAWATFGEVGVTRGRVERTIRGGDLSGLAKNEAFGARYADAHGRRGDAVRILAGAGMNLGRLKVWVDPADGFNDKAQVVAMGKRIKAAGMKLLVDFHYSDRWTDPGAQGIPHAWQAMTPAQLADAVHAHTLDVLRALKVAGATADYVQVGNEINPGMLWPWGQTWDVDPSDDVVGAQWDNLAAFLTAGARAVKEVSRSTKVLLHLTNINNGIDSLTWWFDEVVARNVPFDLIGLSYYGYWHGSLADLQAAVTTLSARYDRDVLVVETAYPFTLADDAPAFANIINQASQLVPGYPATPAGQAAAFRAVQNAVASAEGGRGIGTVYWEPAWTSVAGAGWDPADPSSGNAWENQALFDFDGKLLPAARNFSLLSKG